MKIVPKQKQNSDGLKDFEILDWAIRLERWDP